MASDRLDARPRRRDVAIKILPAEFASDPERFEREAKLLASLNHPNIAGIYGFHEANGVRFLAMELVPGEDLAERLKKGTVPFSEAIEIAGQIAEGLEAAHAYACSAAEYSSRLFQIHGAN